MTEQRKEFVVEYLDTTGRRRLKAVFAEDARHAGLFVHGYFQKKGNRTIISVKEVKP